MCYTQVSIYPSIHPLILLSIHTLTDAFCFFIFSGDFRLNLYETQKLRPLHHEGTDRVINLQTLYIDTTFCHDKARQIISRVS